MTDKHLTQSPAGEFIMFASDDGEVRVECRFEQETLWLPQATIANLYRVTPQAITQHIKAIYEEGELEQNATCKSYLQVQQEGNRQVSRNMLHYSLPVILAVGYRVRSPRGTQFRQWATQTLQEYLIKGFLIFLRDWQDKLDQFLQFNDRAVLQGAGKISKKMADEKAQAEYSQFGEQQRRLKEAEGEKDIANLLQWTKEDKT
ncbi:virulence RhuM family protein [Photorhabdus luminescens]|uniref:virulence RhuM family protein n=1 Tax=Photorhabdus luminescens TaxID=29488 RepID=UPI00223F79C0|nr:RhuM family protein [Photorhabdus luminescens]MCW7761363.1 virulence RhuM family protein [Photorhabdus luminescens subsp. venezuelensis]